MKVFASGSVSEKGNKKLVKDGRSGLKHPSGWSRSPHQCSEGQGEDSAVGAAGLACQSHRAGNGLVSLGPGVRLAPVLS